MRIHFIGIAGIGMSAIARHFVWRGHQVQGSDAKPGRIAADLERMGIRIFPSHATANVEGADLIVYSSSIPADHPERAAAAARGLRVIHRSEALAMLCEGKAVIAVTGTHGKTTTTSMIGVVFRSAGRDPSLAVGGLVRAFGGNACAGKGPEFVVEADESDSSFLNLSPDLVVVTNIEAEHMDHFGTMANVEDAYRRFILSLPADGVWIGCAEDALVRKLAAERLRPCRLYGFTRADGILSASDIVECPGGRRAASFTAWDGAHRLGRVELEVIGTHNVLNALAALAAAAHRGVGFETAAPALRLYEGAGRRFDVKYEDESFLIVNDYAHHPTEIRTTLGAARALKRKRTVAVFQPHRYSRTESLLEEFGSSFGDADKLFITDVYSAGEAERKGVSGRKVSETVTASGHRDAAFVERADVTRRLMESLRPGDLVIALGAGDIHQVADEISQELRRGRFAAVKGRVLLDEPLSRHVSLKIGGPCDYWIEPADAQDLARALEICRSGGIRWAVAGNGSNLLPADEGFRGAVIHLGGRGFRKIGMEPDGTVRAGVGVLNTQFIAFALERGLGGFEFLSGVPGNIGGAVAMNAGSHGRSVDAVLAGALIMDGGGKISRRPKEAIPFRYRASGLAQGEIVLEADFRLPAAPRADVVKLLEEYHGHRSRTQDLQHASAGCMFKNPAPDRSAGRLIDEAGLKGLRIGRAQVSERHGNFLINSGGATAKDVRELIEKVRSEVKKKFGVELETEVRTLE